jgi:hypothetical protein
VGVVHELQKEILKMAVKEKVIAHDIDGNELQEGDRVQIVELGGRAKLWLNATAIVSEITVKSSGAVQCRIAIESSPSTKFFWNEKWLRKLSSEIVEINPLDESAAKITELWADSENAEEVANQAAYSALDSARLCGEELLKAKRLAGHGNWEKFRATLLHPKTGKPMPSSTATLYQRIAERWAEIEASEVRSLRSARELLKSDRQISAAKPESATVTDLPVTQSIEQVIDSSEHLETTPSIRSDYGKNVSDEIADSLTSLGVMPCKPSISPEEFNREMAKSGLITQDIKIINPRLKRCEFLCNGVLKNGVISGVLFDWKRMSVAAVLIDYDDGKQIQVSASNAWLIDEQDNESNDQPINRFAAIEELERRGWFWDAARRIDINGDYCYWANISSPKCDIKEVFFAQRFECLEDALENCIEEAKKAGVWEVEQCQS